MHKYIYGKMLKEKNTTAAKHYPWTLSYVFFVLKQANIILLKHSRWNFSELKINTYRENSSTQGFANLGKTNIYILKHTKL